MRGSTTPYWRSSIRGFASATPIMGARTWKSFGWEAMGRLHDKGLISDPVGRTKSLMLTDTGLRRAETSFRRQAVNAVRAPDRSHVVPPAEFTATRI